MKAIASYSKSGSAYLPKIIGEGFKAVMRPKDSFLGYVTKEAAICLAQHDIDNNSMGTAYIISRKKERVNNAVQSEIENY